MTEAAKNVTPIRPTEPPAETVWTALLEAQKAFANAPIDKTARGARETELYAPLDEVLAILRPILTANGLASTALPHVQNDHMLLQRKLVHAASGTEIVMDYPVAPISKPPRELGSALTYARRYSLLAICDVHPSKEDDDGQEGSKSPPPKQQDKVEDGPTPEQLTAFAREQAAMLKACESPRELNAYKAKLFGSKKFALLDERDPQSANKLRKLIADLDRDFVRNAPSSKEALDDEIPF